MNDRCIIFFEQVLKQPFILSSFETKIREKKKHRVKTKYKYEWENYFK